jgi:hypothetical protein
MVIEASSLVTTGSDDGKDWPFANQKYQSTSFR